MISKKKLWEAQLKFFPESVRVTNSEMVSWAWEIKERKNYSPEVETRTWLQIAHTIQYSNGVFYRTSNRPDAYVGFRFGLEGYQYLSGWTRWDGGY
jgi:hypothetical protein